MISDTELRLPFWRDGSTNAERLVAAALKLSGYEELDPQNPLGGPDGKKDIICRKGGISWVAAVYFPNGPLSFTKVKAKFKSDLAGTPAQHKGFVFVTNQTLSPGQRKTLNEMVVAVGKEPDIVHLQRLQSLLDQPAGYGVRIQYLGIAMSMEDQLSWASKNDNQTAKALATHKRELMALRASIERMKAGQDVVLRTMAQVLPTPDLISEPSFTKKDDFANVSAGIDPALVLLVHRLAYFDLPSRIVGKLRTSDVWLGDGDGRRADHIAPPPADQVEAQLIELCARWRKSF